MERCPNCRAKYSGGENCRRCGIEFKWLLSIQENASTLRLTMIKALTEGDYAQAKQLIQQHQQLINDPLLDSIALFLDA